MMDDSRWDAIAARNGKRELDDENFVYGVKTTGIFCKPGCPSRRPLRRNVVFFNSPGEAQSAGFRPCKRCRPEEAWFDIRHGVIAAACRRLELEEEPQLDDLSEAMGYSTSHFQKLFKKAVGLSPHEYAAAVRTGRFLEALRANGRITDAIYEAGYTSSSRAYEELKGHTVLTPGELRSGGKGQNLRFAVAPCSYGWAIAALSEKGLCAAFYGEDPEELLGKLAERFPKAELSESGIEESSLFHRVFQGMDSPAMADDLPLDIQGTAFQKRVWKALRDIPPGQTAAYGDVAREIGKPGAVRAVASACAANSIAVFIPCHRVIRSDGAIGGYRWGNERKKTILIKEKESIGTGLKSGD